MSSQKVSRSRFSVVVATYNGEKFIEEQLWSIANQTLEPSEIIITDDGSTDRTTELVMAFSQQTKIKTKVIENLKVPRGVTSNFEIGIKAARCEIVVFADQDDVWNQEKLEVIDREFSSDTGWVCSDAAIVDPDLSVTRPSLFEQIGFNPTDFNALSPKKQLVLLLKRPHMIYGMSLAVRRSTAHALLPMTSKSRNFTHDAWLSIGIVAMGFPGRAIERQLVMYRAHSGQVAGAPQEPISWYKTIVSSLKKTRIHDRALPKALNNLAYRILSVRECSSSCNHRWACKMIAMSGMHMYQRIKAHEAGRISSFLLIMIELLSGRFHKVGGGIKTALRDIIG